MLFLIYIRDMGLRASKFMLFLIYIQDITLVRAQCILFFIFIGPAHHQTRL